MEEIVREMENTSCWYVVYTAVRSEKKLKEQLDKAGFENYLPLQPIDRLWNNYKKRVMTPVVSRCIFVHLPESDVAKVATMKGISFLLRDEKHRVAISNDQMIAFRWMIEQSGRFIEFAPAGSVSGKPVRVVRGQLQGMVAELVNISGEDHKLAFHIEGLGSALTSVDIACIE